GGSGGSRGSAAGPDGSSDSPDGGVPGQDGGASDAGSGGGQSDAGSDGGAAPDACRTLMPAQAGNPVLSRTDPLPPTEYGLPGTTDGRGEVLVPTGETFDDLGLSIFDPSGKLLSGSQTVGASSFGRDAIGVADGFIGVQNPGVGFPSHRV